VIILKLKVFNDDKLCLLGQDAIAILIHELMYKKIMEDFSFSIQKFDYRDKIKNEVFFQKDFDTEYDYDYVLFHLVMFGATILKYNAMDYVMKKKLFGGYTQNITGAFSFVNGLESGIKNFRQKGKLCNIREIVDEFNGLRTSYSYGKTLSTTPIPYFYFEHNNKQLNEISLDFAKNIANIRQPQNPDIVIGVFNERAKEIVPLAHNILHHFFVV
jgi:hypothetical protein